MVDTLVIQYSMTIIRDFGNVGSGTLVFLNNILLAVRLRNDYRNEIKLFYWISSIAILNGEVDTQSNGPYTNKAQFMRR